MMVILRRYWGFEKMVDHSKLMDEIDYNNIDRFFVPIIKGLNQLGYITKACCSGLDYEHDEVALPYIAFRKLSPERTQTLFNTAKYCGLYTTVSDGCVVVEMRKVQIMNKNVLNKIRHSRRVGELYSTICQKATEVERRKYGDVDILIMFNRLMGGLFAAFISDKIRLLRSSDISIDLNDIGFRDL